MKKVLIFIMFTFIGIKIFDTKHIESNTDTEEERETPDSVYFQY